VTSQLWAGRAVGLLGGSFNPAHAGHRHISLLALKYLGLDAVWWLVSPQNPLKSSMGMAPLQTRLQTAETVAAHPRIFVTALETKLGTRYTADTLHALKSSFPTTRFVWLMGMDNLQQVHHWQKWQDIFNIMPICVLDRPPRGQSIKSCPAFEKFRNYLLPQEGAARLKFCCPPAWTILHTPLNDLSATQLRQAKHQ
jgi:nicotinate-nucleotide adenylyltransferase